MLNSITRRAPLARPTMHDQMTRFLDDVFNAWAAPPAAPTTRAHFPALNVQETPDAYHVEAELPGFTMDQIDVSLLGETLTISGGRAAEDEQTGAEEGARWLRRERRAQRFERSVTLPAPVKEDQVGASLRDGVLSITLPKIDAPKRVKISVNAG
jgi:HSP20 family protein